jgi:hypothetical protein
MAFQKPSAVSDGEIRRDLEPGPLDVDEKLTPALRALPRPSLEKTTSSFLPSAVAPISTMHSAFLPSGPAGKPHRAMWEIGRRGRSGGMVSRHFDDLRA